MWMDMVLVLAIKTAAPDFTLTLQFRIEFDCEEIEKDRDWLAGDKLELAGARHMIEADLKEKLRRDHAVLAARR